ncbi:MAG: NERD domain-containing protein [Leptolyngbya sp. SIOISBB]|nr:NERD domain-containing protein [Leptolyngbya sp. SIOISBB]
MEFIAVAFFKKRGFPKRQSPLKAKPLRNPGQSLDEELERLINDAAILWIAAIAISFVMVYQEWHKWYTQTPPNPRAALIVAIPVIGVSLIRLFFIVKRTRRLKMARDGEKAVGQYLSDLQAKGYRVFHDILGDGFNVDHIIISDRGIFTVETKTYSKPSKGHSEIQFDGETLLINGQSPYRDPVTQAKAQADWSRQVLQESTGKIFPVKAVIVFPGWYVQSTAKGKRSNLWVLNPKALPAFIEQEPARLQQEDVQLAAYHLSRYIRTK